MNLKKNLVRVIAIILFAILAIVQAKGVYAQEQTPPVCMGIVALMTDDSNPNEGYSILKPGSNGASQIWNIVKYPSGPQAAYQEANIYCVKAGLGFNEGHKTAQYDRYYNMLTERSSIREQNDYLRDLVEKQIDTYSRYNALLALLDRLYLPRESTEVEKKELIYKTIQEALETLDELENATDLAKAFGSEGKPLEGNSALNFLASGSPTDYELTEYALTDNDISAVQQAAIWYFTNYGEEENKYDKTEKTTWLYHSLTGGEDYDSLANYATTGRIRNIQAEALYKMLIKEAKENASKYAESSSELGVPIRINKKELKRELSGEYYILGPFNVEQLNSRPYTIGLEVKNGGSVVSYTLLNGQKQEEEGDLKSFVGKGDFYIKVAKDQTDQLSIKMNANYSNYTMKLWASNTNNEEQPLVEVNKENVPIEETFTIEPEEPEKKPFDLALRKYITKINGQTLEQLGQISRVPSINKSTINTLYTATYNHKKDPVTIKTGDLVTYELTIYNEGKKSGRANKIVDQLPIGLEFKRVVSGDFIEDPEAPYQKENDNKLTLKRTNEANLNPYNESTLSSEKIEIECSVTATPDRKEKKILTNVAWISEEYDAEERKTIVNIVGEDRDSEPGTTPKAKNGGNVNKENMSDYTGNGNKENLADKDFYYKGQQDDDDFEKLVLLPESFDLKLIKLITEVNGEAVPDRIKSIDVSKLNTLDDSGNMVTTADYNLDKSYVPVKKGDIVTYTFRIYNEGTIDGYAEEITEDVPEGLEFIWSEKTDGALEADSTFTQKEKEAIRLNQNNLWGSFQYDKPGGKIIKVSSTYLSSSNPDNLITAFGRNDNKDKTLQDLHYKELKVAFKVVSENVSGTVIRNEAAITEDSDFQKQPVEDRDSDPKVWRKYEDDEDFDNVILKEFDLSLRKFIIAVSDDETIEADEYLKNADDSYTRAPKVDTSKLNTQGADGKKITTATYHHPKTPVEVEPNDIVVYMLRVYNEGDIDGYAAEIQDHLPPYLEFINNDYNTQRGWSVSNNGRTVTTKKLEQEKIAKAVKNDPVTDAKNTYKLSYQEVSIMCRVTREAKPEERITNIADITKYLDDNKKSIEDRDSEEKNVTLPEDKKLPEYKEDETGSYVPGQEDDDDFEKVVVKPFDLALRKFIIAVSDDETIDANEYLKNEDSSYTRAPKVDTSKLNTQGEDGEKITTATYHHPKTPVEVKKGDIVVYMLRVYNEGDIDGYAAEIQDHLPPYLEFINNDYNTERGWSVSDDGRTVTTKKLEQEKIAKAVKNESPSDPKDTYKLSYKEVSIMCRVKEEAKTNEPITNIADITKYLDDHKESIEDRDSEEKNVTLPGDEKLPEYKEDETGSYVPGQEDDDDFEKVVVKPVDEPEDEPFDLALRKFIIAVSDDETIEDEEYLKNEDSSYTRAPKVDTSKLNTQEAEGEKITTATYHHPKTPVEVKKGDIVVYMLRVYNEGNVDGYAAEIQDHLPPYLEFINNDYNTQRGWSVSGDGRTVTTNKLEGEKIAKAVKNESPSDPKDTYKLSYKEVSIMCRVKEEAKTDEPITNIADITKYLDDHKESIEDRDSEEKNVTLPGDEKLPEYKEDETGSYVPGQEDDDDFEKVVVKPVDEPEDEPFDLALRKFITKIEDRKVDSRIPQVSYDKENDKIQYEHGKDPLTVVNGNIVEYTLRIFNEGAKNGYASQVLDDIPEGLEFLPENSTNIEYRWKMYKKSEKGQTGTVVQDGESYIETEDPKEAEVIVTDYLSKEQGEERMKNDQSVTENPNLLKAFDKTASISETNPDYKDVIVAFKVIEPNSSKKIIVNSAQISEDTDEDGNEIEDKDSVTGEWNDGEDDQDKEYIELREFDLALRKWVTQAIVIENGKQTVTQTGHQPYDDPEQVVKVEIVQSKLNKVTVKFRYSIRVINQGDIEGYAKEVTDYVPKGLKFVAADNPGWTDEGNNVISTKLLENTLLKPGEYADVEVVLTWINSENGLGTVMTNQAEISKDDNPYDVPDKDSTPDNKKAGEDDIDDAPVILSIKTGQAKIYFTLGFTVLITTALGIILIKKYVL